jgi:hypothetical protein
MFVGVLQIKMEPCWQIGNSSKNAELSMNNIDLRRGPKVWS